MTLSKPPLASLNTFAKKCLQAIADLRLALALLLLIALFSISGTIIEQGESPSFYEANYPAEPALLGFLSSKVIFAWGLDHVYQTPWFMSLLVLLGTSLTACTVRRQWPALQAAGQWRFYDQPRQFEKLAFSRSMPGTSTRELIPLLQSRGYKIFTDAHSPQALYARKGLAGKIGPIVVHASLLIILGGAIWGALGGFLAQEMIPSGESFQVHNIIEAGRFSQGRIPQDWGIKVNRFWIDYQDNGTIDQFYSDLSVVSSQGQELDRRTISVNHPLRYQGVTFYQTNWGIAGVRVQINNSPVFQLPMAPLATEKGGKLWGTWIPTQPDLSAGVALLTQDLQGTLILYDQAGNLTTAVRPGMAVEINGVNLKILELVGSTGLQIKADPGIPFVYLGFGLLMLGVIMSYISHSQVWALVADGQLYWGGRTNRAQVALERELAAIAAEVTPS